MQAEKFKELRAPSDGRTRQIAPHPYDIILVHGLREKGTARLRGSLKAWLRSLEYPPPVKSAGIYEFGFKTTDLLSKGTKRLAELSDYLRRKLVPFVTRGRKLIFLGHGIASVVLQETLASYNSFESGLVEGTAGVVLIGFPEFEGEPDWIEFRTRFLKRFSKNQKPLHALKWSQLEDTKFNFNVLKKERQGLVIECAVVPRESDRAVSTQRAVARSGTDSSHSSASSSGEVDTHQLSLPEIRSGDLTHHAIVDASALMIMGYKSKPTPSNLSRPVSSARKDLPSQDRYTSNRSTPATANNEDTYQGTTSPTSRIPSSAMPKSDAQSPHKVKQSTILPDLPITEEPLSNSTEVKDYARGRDALSTSGPAANTETALLENLNKLCARASSYHQSGELQQAKRLYDECLQFNSNCQSKMPKWVVSDKWIIEVQCEIAIVSLHEGQYWKAEEAFQTLGKAAAEKLGLEHEKTLDITRWLGVSFDKQGRYSEASSKLDEVLKKMTKIMDTGKYNERISAKNASILTSNALSLALCHKGDFEGAKGQSDYCLELAHGAINEATTDASTATDSDEKRTAKAKKRLSRVQSDRAHILAFAGDFKEADSANRQALVSMERQFGTRHAATLDCRAFEAQLLVARSRTDEAEQMCQKTIEAMREELGKEHPSTLQALGTLVAVYTSQARLTEAKSAASYVFELNGKILGTSHPQTINSKCELAAVHTARGELAEALLLQQEAADASKRWLGSSHPITLHYMSELASIYCEKGDRHQAKIIASSVLWAQCRIFLYATLDDNEQMQFKPQDGLSPALSGSDPRSPDLDDDGLRQLLNLLRPRGHSLRKLHPSLISTIQCLGTSEREREMGDLSLALDFCLLAFEWREKYLGKDHTDTLSSLVQLGITQRQLGDIEAATKSLTAAYSAYVRILGNAHPDSLSARHELSVVEFVAGKVEEAQKDQERIWKARTLLLGDNHPNTIRSRLDLANVYQASGKFDEAEKFQVEALKCQLIVNDPKCFGYLQSLKPETPTALRNEILQKLRLSPSKAIQMRSTREVDTPQIQLQLAVLASIENLASICAYKEDFATAIEFQRVLVAHQEALRGNSHITVIKCIRILASMLEARDSINGILSDLEEAKKLYDRLSNIVELFWVDRGLYYIIQLNRASLCFKTGDYEKGEEVQSNILRSLREHQDSTHIDDPQALIDAIFNLIMTKKGVNKTPDISFLQEIMKLSNQALDINHPLNRELFDKWAELMREIGASEPVRPPSVLVTNGPLH